MNEQMIEKMKAGMAMCPMCREMNCEEMMEKMKAGSDPTGLFKDIMEKMAGVMQKTATKS